MSLLPKIIVAAGLPLRIILDIASAIGPRREFDLAYAILFFVIGGGAFFLDVPAWLGVVGLCVGLWYLYRYVRAPKMHNA